DLKLKEDKNQRLQNELRHLLESLAILLSSPGKYVESQEDSIKNRIRELLQDNKEKSTCISDLREKVSLLSQQLNRQTELYDQANNRLQLLQEEKNLQESRLHKVEADLNAAELSQDALRRDKNIYMTFLERLGRAMHVDEISKEVGMDLHTETLLVRAEQLARLESDKLIDKYWWTYSTFPRLRRERSYHDLPLREVRCALLRISSLGFLEALYSVQKHELLVIMALPVKMNSN
ncbi:Coiled-coil domain-containing protein C6orf97, partial [Gryllus bimaculatus]